MSARRTLAIARRIAEQFRRDRRSLALLVLVPLAVLGLLGYVIHDQKPLQTRFGIVNLGGAPAASVASALADAATRAGLPLVDVGSDETSARSALRDGRVDVVVVIPPGSGGVAPAVTVITLGEAPADDGARLQTLAGLLGSVSGTGPRLTIQHATVYGSPNADALDAFAPALIGFFGFFFVFILTGVSFLRERIDGTLERLLATPVRRGEIVAGYSLGFGLFATIQVAIILLFALGLIAVPAIGPIGSFELGLGIANAGNPLLAFLVVLLTAIGAVNLAILLSTFARTELQILQFIPIVLVPQALLGGVFWSVSRLPDPLQPIARALPMTYAIDGLRAVLVRAADLSTPDLQRDLAVLAGVAILFVALAAATIRREIA